MLAAYGLAVTDAVVGELVDGVIDQQRTVLRRFMDLAEQGHQPQADWAAAGHLDELRARIRWSEEFRGGGTG